MRCWPSAARASSSRECLYIPCDDEDDSEFSEGEPTKYATGREAEDCNHEVLADAKVCVEEDMYDAVTVAAFGGVVLELPKGSIRVHPIWLVCLCIPLYAAQQASLLYLRLGQDLDSPVHGQGVDAELIIILPFAKVLMIYVLALMLFPELLGALRLMMFLANPTTWTDIKRVNPAHHERLAFMWYRGVLLPLAFLAETLKFTVGYIVLVDSVSVVLVCDTVQDTLFNSLALTFLADLDNKLWEIAKSVFHLKYSEPVGFQLKPVKERREAAEQACISISEDSWLHRHQGAAAIEASITSIIFMGCYCRQFLVTQYSLQTDTLPVARDMCTLWELTESDSWYAMLGRTVLRSVSMYVHPNGMLNRVCNPDLGGYCSPLYRRIQLSDMMDLISKHPSTTVANMVTFGLILLIPQFLQMSVALNACGGGNLGSCFRLEYDHEEDEPFAKQREVEELREEVRLLKEQLKKSSNVHFSSASPTPNGIRNVHVNMT
ncbi:unnamed protein product [Effrenium voratum]|nr:unnamed protein product [Effrenium voratum]